MGAATEREYTANGSVLRLHTAALAAGEDGTYERASA
jgi:hypothetical protein